MWFMSYSLYSVQPHLHIIASPFTLFHASLHPVSQSDTKSAVRFRLSCTVQKIAYR